MNKEQRKKLKEAKKIISEVKTEEHEKWVNLPGNNREHSPAFRIQYAYENLDLCLDRLQAAMFGDSE